MIRFFISSIVAVFAASVVVAGFWVSGFDFDQRGGVAVGCYLMAVLSSCWVFGMAMLITSKS